MKKVLIVNDIIIGGGVEKLTHDIILELNKKCEVTVLTYKYDDSFYDYFPQSIKYKSFAVPKQYRSNLFVHVMSFVNRILYEKTLFWRLNKEHFDVLLSMKDGKIMKDCYRIQAKKKIAWVHTDYRHYYYTKNIYGSAEAEATVMKQFDSIVCVSEDVKEGLLEIVGDTGNLVVKYNPVNRVKILDLAEEPVVDIDEKVNGVVRFVSVGRISYQKGYDLLLEACHMLDMDGLKYEVYVIGEQDRGTLEAERVECNQKRLSVSNVHFIGSRKNPYKYMKVADWFLSTSIFEGYSYVSQEAAILGIPLLVTECSGVRELIGDDVYGISMERSVIGIYEGMKKVIEHPELRAVYANKIKERSSVITFEERMSEIEKLLV